MTPRRLERWQNHCRFGLTVASRAARIVHLSYPAPFFRITSGWVPYPSLVISLTGICELAGAIGLCTQRFLFYAGLGLALYAICVYPANIKHAIDALSGMHPSIWMWSYHIVRLSLQPVFVWLALFTGQVLHWPFSSEAAPATVSVLSNNRQRVRKIAPKHLIDE